MSCLLLLEVVSLKQSQGTLLLESCSSSWILTLSGLHVHADFLPLGTRQLFLLPQYQAVNHVPILVCFCFALCSLLIPGFRDISIPGGWTFPHTLYESDQFPNISAKSTPIKILHISVHLFHNCSHTSGNHQFRKYPYCPHRSTGSPLCKVFYILSLQEMLLFSPKI